MQTQPRNMRSSIINFSLAAPICCFIILLSFANVFSSTFDTITATNPLSFNKTIISAGRVFELGFFSPRNSAKWYVGVWYHNIAERTYVWVANRDRSLKNSSGILRINQVGNLVLLDQSDKTIWSSNGSIVGNTVAQLLDSGNLVVRHENDLNPDNYLWQSFDYPTDTLLPGMKLGWDSKSGLNRHITSWKNSDDPSIGDYVFRIDISGFPEAFLWNKQVKKLYRSGPWNGLRFSGVPEMKSNPTFSFIFEMNKDSVYYVFKLHNESLYSRLMVSSSGYLQRYTWIDTSKIWNPYWYAPKDQCDKFGECGSYGVCDNNASPVCKCEQGFKPKNNEAWNLRDGSDGCVRKTELNCVSDGFLLLKNMKVPESSNSFINKTTNLADCRWLCQKNCSCTAYSSFNVTNGGSGCVIWINELGDMRQYASAEGGQDLHIRVSAADLEQPGGVVVSENASRTRKRTTKIVSITVAIAILLFMSGLCFMWKRTKLQNAANNIEHKGLPERSQDLLLIQNKREISGERTMDEELELPLFDFNTLVMATNNFSESTKLGQGGFGRVYKGLLIEGEEIAVKRLSKNSVQGIQEFKNEVILIARLQHRNLVRLLGCCIEKEEKILVYEYMENRSLDSILFNKEKSPLLNWQRRFNIICGTARGLLYLHQDSRFRIIHRDLKASNILLDKEMNPKISDFGMARIFGRDQTEANTKKVVGTYGYMSPEYAMDGLFSVKSDAFSFGVLVLEIVSGKKNRGFYTTDNHLNLLAYAWKLWRDGKGLELLDPSTSDSYSSDEVMRCIQVGLLCVQEQAEDRPTMASVVLMLNSESRLVTQPKHPGFCLGRRQDDTDSSNKQDETCTINQVTVTILDGR